MKIYNNRTQSQEKQERNLKGFWAQEKLLLQLVMNDLTEGYKRVADVLLGAAQQHSQVFLMVPTIAHQANLSERQTRKAINHLRDNGFMKTKQRWNKSLLFFLNPILFHKKVMNQIRSLFAAFNSFIKPNFYGLKEKCRLIRYEVFKSSYKPLLLTLLSLSSSPHKLVTPDQVPKKGRMMTQRKIVSEVLKYIDLKDNELFQLDEYSDKQIETALFSFKKKGFVERPGAYLMGALRNMHDKKTAVKRSGNQRQNPIPQLTPFPSPIREEPLKREESIQEKTERLTKAYLASMQVCQKFEEDLHMDRLNNPNVVFFKQCALKKMKEECDYLLKCIKEHDEQKS